MKLHYWESGLKFEPRDIWVGVYWKRYPCALELFICFLPMLPWRLYFQWHYQGER